MIIAVVVMEIILILVNLGAAFYILSQLYREKGIAQAALGFFFSPYLYIWGWLNASRPTSGPFKIRDMMIFWTFVMVVLVVFQGVVISNQMLEIGQLVSVSTETSLEVESGESASSPIHRGSIDVGEQTTEELDGLFDLHDWTFQGQAGQKITIRCAPAPGADTDPELDLLGPDGQILAEDDDGGGEYTALISDFTLPEDGTYTIRIEVWTTGEYVLSLD
jgi:hypothetical protein